MKSKRWASDGQDGNVLRVIWLLVVSGLLAAAVGFALPVQAGKSRRGVDEPAALIAGSDTIVVAAGEGAVVTARVRDRMGRPVQGVEVGFVAEGGVVEPDRTVTGADGTARTTFTGGQVAGGAEVVVESRGLEQTVYLQVDAPRSIATLELAVADTLLKPGDQVEVIAIVQDQRGEPLAGEVVSFFGSYGTVLPVASVSDGNGRVSVLFTSGEVAGQATISALSGYGSASAGVRVLDTVPEESDFDLYVPLVVSSDQR